jgi:hypothetical protein
MPELDVPNTLAPLRDTGSLPARLWLLITILVYSMWHAGTAKGLGVRTYLLNARAVDMRVVGLVASLLVTVACGAKDTVVIGGADPAGGSGTEGPEGSADGAARGHLLIVTERESPEANLQYLHVLDGWPESGQVDYGGSIELGEFVSSHVLGDAIFVHQPDDATVRKLVVGADGAITLDETISFAAYGAAGSTGDMVYVSDELAYFLDEGSAQIVVWNPSTMLVSGAAPIAEAALARGVLPAQISRGIGLGGQGFVAASWRDWETLEYHDAAAMGVFDATLQPELQIIEDDRCASTVTTPFDGGDGFVYLISDAALGFDALANPNRTQKSLCVLRMRPGASEFDPDFFVDLRDVLGAPGFYAAHPMDDGKLLVNTWAPGVELAGVANPEDPDWYWDFPPHFEYAVVDLIAGTSTPVPDLGRAAVQWSLTLRVDGGTYVQTYRDDRGSDLSRVEPDGSVVRVLSNPAGSDVQYLGHVGN